MRSRLPKYVYEPTPGYFYYRRAGLARVRLPGLPDSREFLEAYLQASAAALPVEIGADRTEPGTVADVVVRYLKSAAYATLAPSSQRKLRNMAEAFRAEHGSKAIARLQAEHINIILSNRRPYAQRNWLRFIRALLTCALDNKLIAVNPSIGVKIVRVKNSGGFKTWPPEAIDQYRRHHALGTRERLALELLLGTMAARSDAVRLGRQHIRDGIISFHRRKTDAAVDIPVLPELQEAIDAMPLEGLTFLLTDSGQPFTGDGFANSFRKWCAAAGLSELSPHGLRKAGAERLAEADCTDLQIMAWGGWKTLKEVQRYTRGANRKKMALEAAHKLRSRTELSKITAAIVKLEKKP
jgi:integrase